MTIFPHAKAALHRVIVGLANFALRGKGLALVTVVICAVFAAKTVSSLVEAEVLLPTAAAAPTPAPHRIKPAAPTVAINSNVMTERNIFCSSCEADVSYTGYQGDPVVLIALSASDSGRRATLRVVPTDVQGSWGLDDTIPGVGKITRIGGTSIDVVDVGNHLKKISLLDGAGPVGKPDEPAPSTDPFASRIKKIAENSYEVERDVVRELVASAGQGAGARAMPVMEKGEIKGLRLFGVKPTSAVGAIGLKSNDVLSAIDGDPIKTANQMLDLLSRLDKMSGLELQGTRGGKPLAITLKFH